VVRVQRGAQVGGEDGKAVPPSGTTKAPIW